MAESLVVACPRDGGDQRSVRELELAGREVAWRP